MQASTPLQGERYRHADINPLNPALPACRHQPRRQGERYRHAAETGGASASGMQTSTPRQGERYRHADINPYEGERYRHADVNP